jgi:hypothetical protein
MKMTWEVSQTTETIEGGPKTHPSLLSSSQQKVKAKYLVRFRALTDLFNIDQNFKNYRDSLLTCKPPIVPYIGLFPKVWTSKTNKKENQGGEGGGKYD